MFNPFAFRDEVVYAGWACTVAQSDTCLGFVLAAAASPHQGVVDEAH